MKKIALLLTALLTLGTAQLNGQTTTKPTIIRDLRTTVNTKTITIRDGVKYVGDFNGGLAWIKPTNGEWFVIDKAGNKQFTLPKDWRPAQVTESNEFLSSVNFDNGRMMIVTGANYKETASIIDTKGNTIKKFEKVRHVTSLNDGLAIMERMKGREWLPVYIDANGNEVPCALLKPKGAWDFHYNVYQMKEGLRLYYNYKNKTWGYMNAKCQGVIPAKFKDAYSFSRDGLARVQDMNGLWGYIDTSGNYAIEPMFTNKVGAFYGGLAKVTDKTGQTVYFINKQGKFVYQFTPDTSVLIEDYIWAGNNIYSVWTFGGCPNIINSSFKSVAKLPVNGIGDISGRVSQATANWFIFTNGSYNRIFDWQGNQLASYESHDDYCGHYFSEGLCANGVNYFNEKLEIVIQFKDSQF